MTRTRRLLSCMLVLGLMGAAVGAGTYSALSEQTGTYAGSFDAGTVALSDNDAGSAMFGAVSGMKPTDAVRSRCLRVTYGGTLPADVRLYAGSDAGALGPYLDLVVTPGTGSAATCSDFVATGAALQTSSLEGFAERSGWATGVPVRPPGGGAWATGDAVTLRFAVSLRNTTEAEGKASTGIVFRWEARDQ